MENTVHELPQKLSDNLRVWISGKGQTWVGIGLSAQSSVQK